MQVSMRNNHCLPCRNQQSLDISLVAISVITCIVAIILAGLVASQVLSNPHIQAVCILGISFTFFATAMVTLATCSKRVMQAQDLAMGAIDTADKAVGDIKRAQIIADKAIHAAKQALKNADDAIEIAYESLDTAQHSNQVADRALEIARR